MHFTSGLVALSLAALSAAQTPSGFTPRSDNFIGIAFNGTCVDPNGKLIPMPLTQTAPSLWSNGSYPGVYTFALVDLAIPYKVVNTTDFSTLVPGDSNLGANRTTRLHWWMDNVTQAADGTFSGNSTLADYEGPQPPAGDVPHEYTIFLFNRPSSFVPMANSEAFYDASTYNGDDRMNFSVPALAAQLGNPIASRYFTVVRGNGTATAAGNTTASKPTSTAMPYTGGASRVGMTVSGLGLVALVSALLL